jgi:hypothetical protein
VRVPSFVIALGVVVGGFIVGGILVAVGFEVIGVIVAAASLPVALVAWVVAADRLLAGPRPRTWGFIPQG